MSDSNKTELSYVKETSFGVVPTNPAFQKLRFTGETLRHAKDTIQSEEIRADRQITDLVEVGNMANGEISYEFSSGTFNALIAAALCASTAVGIVVNETTTVTVDASDNKISRDAGSWGVTPIPGQFVRISGLATPANNGIKRVVSADANDIIVEAGGFTTDETSVAAVGIRGTAWKNGNVNHSFSLERKILDPSNADFFQTYVGMHVDEWTLSAVSKQILKGSFTWMGKLAELSDTPASGSTYGAQTSTQVMNGTRHVGAITRAGAVLTEKLREITFTVKNNLRAKDALGITGPYEIGLGSCEVTGKVSAYFKDNVLYQEMISHGYSSLGAVFTDGAGNTFAFLLPKTVFSTGDPNAQGQNQDIMLDLNFQAIRDPDTDATIIVTHIPAP